MRCAARIGDGIALMVDYNQALDVPDALARGRALDGENIYWLEEPIRHDDYAGYARLKRALKTPIQIGENFSLPFGMEAALDAGRRHLCDAGPRADRRRHRLAARGGARRRSTASRCRRTCSRRSARICMTATPTRHFLEYVDWADRIVCEPLKIVDGQAIVPDRPGNGLVWDEAAVARYRV